MLPDQRRKSSVDVDFFPEYGEGSRYRIEEVIGNGSYGVVCSAYDTHTGEKVAIKKTNDIFEHVSDATRILREIKLLRLLRHPDIVYIKHILLPPSRREFKDIYVVFELMESDLHQVIKANDDLTPEHYQFFLYQLLRGLKYIHTANVFHRDLKPKNILANADCKLKICDFGLARVTFNDTPTAIFWTDYVATRWYRAPELCGSFFSKYTPAIDIWSIGCIFAELLTGKPLFPGKNVVHQLDLMTDLLGTPSLEAIARVRNEKARRYLSSMRKKKPIPLSQKFPNADPLALRLLERMLAFEPKDRPTAEEALADPYFKGLAKVEREPSAQPVSKMEFEFERRRITKEDVRELIYREILEYHPKMLKEYLEGAEPTNLMYPRARYDVFLSFRGEDTRATFSAHLYSSLSNVGIVVFKDDTDLPRGNDISIELLLGIQSSTISIIIFSKDYAGSRWCLTELSKIMEVRRAQGQVVLPVFYGVDPSEVRNQISNFGEAFRDLIQRCSPTKDQVSRWRTDLREAGGIAGFVVLNSKNESEDIKKIIEHVCKMLDKKDLFIANHPVGVDPRLQGLIKISESHSMNDVLLLGIWGMGGIGKTTIAKSIYNEIGRTFESRCFLSNIREVWGQDNGPVNLQQQLLSEICKTTTTTIRSIDSGKIELKESLLHKRALVVLDDVNTDKQLDALCGSHEWFGPGSRIIITTRDNHLLKFLKVDHVYEIKKMDESESIELFSWYAFKQPRPKKGFIDLSTNIVAYSRGLPLALQVLGSYLFDREEREWRSVLDKLKRIPNEKIQEKLRISFDGLSDDAVKDIFLDICCFFIGMDRSDVTHILDGSGLFPDIGISVLVERSLVTVDEKNKLGMHDLLRDMGREIIREQSPKKLGKRSRLWLHEEVLDVLSKHNGTEFVEGLALNLSQTDKGCFSTKAFEKMMTLRLLHLGNMVLDGDYKYISRDLRWLHWRGFPLKYIPASLYQKNLVAVELKYSSLEQVWRDPQLLERLKILNCSHSPFLMQTPNFSNIPNLEKLILKNCPKLSMIHPTIGHASKLLLINLKHCIGLCTLPRSIYILKSLKTLILSGCVRIEKLEEDIEQMDSLTTLIADDTAITQMPLSLVRLKRVGYISLCGYRGLSHDVFPALIWSRMSPTNNPLSLIPTYVRMPISLDISNSNIPGPSSSALSSHHNQVHFSRLENCLRHLLIPIGKHDQVTATLLENILQGLTSRNYSDDCVLPGDKYPYWQSFKDERASVKFKVPRVKGCNLKGMIICSVYFPSGNSGNKACESCISVMIINYTKATTLHYRQDSLTSFEEAEWREIISNLDSDDQVEVIVVFGNGFTTKRTAIYLKYYESFDEHMADPSLPSREMQREDKNRNSELSEPSFRK